MRVINFRQNIDNNLTLVGDEKEKARKEMEEKRKKMEDEIRINKEENEKLIREKEENEKKIIEENIIKEKLAADDDKIINRYMEHCQFVLNHMVFNIVIYGCNEKNYNEILGKDKIKLDIYDSKNKIISQNTIKYKLVPLPANSEYGDILKYYFTLKDDSNNILHFYDYKSITDKIANHNNGNVLLYSRLMAFLPYINILYYAAANIKNLESTYTKVAWGLNKVYNYLTWDMLNSYKDMLIFAYSGKEIIDNIAGDDNETFTIKELVPGHPQKSKTAILLLKPALFFLGNILYSNKENWIKNGNESIYYKIEDSTGITVGIKPFKNASKDDKAKISLSVKTFILNAEIYEQEKRKILKENNIEISDNNMNINLQYLLQKKS